MSNADARMRDQVHGFGLRWSKLSAFMRTRVSQASAIIPIAGYALLWSHEVGKLLELHPSLGGGIWFSTQTRLVLIYYGAYFLTFGYVVYFWKCPAEIRRFPVLEDYLVNELQTRNAVQFTRIRTLIGEKIQSSQEVSFDWVWVDDRTPTTLSRELSARTVIPATKHMDRPNSPEENEMHRSTILQAWYLLCEGQNWRWLVISTTATAIGVIFIALPSIEVFILVTSKVLVPVLWR